MKPSNNLIKLTVVAGMVLMFTPSVNAQNCECPEGATAMQNEATSELTFIGEEDYPYFLNIKDLKKYSNIVYDGINLNSPSLRSYTLTSRSNRMHLDASYRKDGSLIKGRLVIKDTVLPKHINVYLVSNGYKDWNMVGNKILVTDFDAKRTEYEVKMQQGKEKHTLFFDHSGKRLKKLSRS